MSLDTRLIQSSVSEENLAEAHRLHLTTGAGIIDSLLQKKAIEEEQLLAAVSAQFNIPFWPELPTDHLNIDFTGLLSIQYLKKHKMPEFVPVNVGNPLDKNLRIIADEAGCRELYALVYSPASSAVHGMYDALDLFYSRTCMNPLHCLHKVPYHWSKCPVSPHGPFNCIGVTDWILFDLLSSIKQDIPNQMPGELFVKEILNQKGIDEFSKREEVQRWIESAEEFRKQSQGD